MLNFSTLPDAGAPPIPFWEAGDGNSENASTDGTDDPSDGSSADYQSENFSPYEVPRQSPQGQAAARELLSFWVADDQETSKQFQPDRSAVGRMGAGTSAPQADSDKATDGDSDEDVDADEAIETATEPAQEAPNRGAESAHKHHSNHHLPMRQSKNHGVRPCAPSQRQQAQAKQAGKQDADGPHAAQRQPLQAQAEDLTRVQPAAVGLATELSTGRFVTRMRNISGQWTSMSQDQRAVSVIAAVNDELMAAGVPPCQVLVGDIGHNAGQLNFSTWTIAVATSLIQQRTIDTHAAADVANTFYHEARHAEQWFRMARLLAGDHQPAAQIANRLSVPNPIAEAAVNNPLARGSADADEASSWFESVYGSGSEHRRQTLNGLPVVTDAMNAARLEFEPIDLKRTQAADAYAVAKARFHQSEQRLAKRKRALLAARRHLQKAKAELRRLESGTHAQPRSLAMTRAGHRSPRASPSELARARRAVKKARKAYRAATAAKQLAKQQWQQRRQAMQAAKATLAQIQPLWLAAKAKLDAATRAYQTTYAAYRALPEEADAWAVGDHAEDIYLSLGS